MTHERVERPLPAVARKLLRDARYRAGKRNLAFEIDLDFVVNKLSLGRCEMSGVFLSMVAADPFAPSLDRHDNEKGYTEENTIVCCHLGNKAKANWPAGHLMVFCMSYIGHHKLSLIAAARKGT